ncbi:MAG: exosortase A [Pseudomonadota bacterium]|mgnify:CR=1 FL=1
MTNAATAPIPLERAIVRSEWARAVGAFLLSAGTFAAAFPGSIATMSAIWVSSSAYHHALFVAPISAWLIFSRKDWGSASPAADYLGVAVLAAASIAALIGQASNVDLIGHAAFVVAIIGAVIAAFGRALAAQWAFPLAFLFFMVPFGDEITPLLQGYASSVLVAALNFSGIETTRDGFMLTTSAGRFEVAASCAGLRFLLASAMIASLISYLAFAGWRKRAACIALALVAAVFANWLRAYLVVIVATVTDRRIGVGPEHVLLGWVFYSALIIGMIVLARRFADKIAVPQSMTKTAAPSRRPAKAALLLGIVVVSTAALYDAAVLSANDTKIGPMEPPMLHARGFNNTGATTIWGAYAPKADMISTNDYRSETAVLMVSHAYFTHDRDGAEIGGGDTRAADGSNWRRLSVSPETMTFIDASRRVKIEALEDTAGRKIDVATLYWLGDKTYVSPAALKLAIAARKLTGRPTEGGVIFVATREEDNADPRAAIREFLAKLELASVSRSAALDKD